MNTLLYFLTIIFFIGLCGIFLNKKNILVIIMCIELVLLSVNSFFLVTSVYLDDLLGQVMTLFVLTVAAAESSIGLAVLLTNYNLKGTAAVEFINTLKG
jgi:NADH-quinone oxidoreductase subunit K